MEPKELTVFCEDVVIGLDDTGGAGNCIVSGIGGGDWYPYPLLLEKAYGF